MIAEPGALYAVSLSPSSSLCASHLMAETAILHPARGFGAGSTFQGNRSHFNDRSLATVLFVRVVYVWAKFRHSRGQGSSIGKVSRNAAVSGSISGMMQNPPSHSSSVLWQQRSLGLGQITAIWKLAVIDSGRHRQMHLHGALALCA